MSRADDFVIRAFDDADFDRLVSRFHETNLVSYRYVDEHQRHTLADCKAYFRGRLLPVARVWVAALDEQLLGFIALEAPWIRQLAIFPEHQRNGVGTALLRTALAHSPGQLRLFTFRRNASARAFYEKHGFVAIAFGVSPAPESEPDVEYLWTAPGPGVRQPSG
jgi:GNAT superfamily N-acetyltransferase